MKRLQLLCAMLTGGTLCASLTGCVTVTNHYPGGTVASQGAPAATVYTAASSGCQCAVPMNHAPAMSAVHAASCPCESAFGAPPAGYYGYLPYPVGQNQATNPGSYSPQPSPSDRSENNNGSRPYEPQIVYVPITPPIVPQGPAVRTDADRTREIVDVLVHAIDALQETGGDDNSSSGGTGETGSSGSTGTGRTGQTGGDATGEIALGGRVGAGGLLTGNPTRNPAGNPGGMGGRAGSSGTNSPSTPEVPGALTGPGGRASSSGSSRPGSLPSSANGSGNTGTVGAVDKDPVSPERLPSSTADSRSGGQNGELIARPTSSETVSVPVPPSSARGGSQETVRKADETVERTIPGTQGTASRQTGSTSREARLGGPVEEQKASTVRVTTNAPASVATGSSTQELRGRQEEATPTKQKAAESEGISSTAAQSQTLSSPTIVVSPKVVSTSAPQAAGTSPGTVQALPADVQMVGKTGTGSTVSMGAGQVSSPE